MPTLRGHRRPDGGEGAKQPLRVPQTATTVDDSENSEEKGACSGTSSIGSAVNADGHRGPHNDPN
jgi:hypothetical protein